MMGIQYNYAVTLWTIGYIIGEIPSNLILTKIRPSIWIPVLELIWSILTICTCIYNNHPENKAVPYCRMVKYCATAGSENAT